jgi:hypothetical protein
VSLDAPKSPSGSDRTPSAADRRFDDALGG